MRPRTTSQWFALLGGGAIFLAMLIAGPQQGLSFEAWVTVALGILMIIWWISEAIPIPVTSMLPLIILPVSGVLPMAEASAAYMSPIVVLLMAGFIVAKGIERWNLHTRIALGVVGRIGTSPPALIAGFMIAAALLSMWISNTATALMMTPIALSVAGVLSDGDEAGRFRITLLLSIAYACSIGGLATPVGSPTNLIVIGYLAELDRVVSFGEWMRLGVPLVIILIPLSWLVLVHYARNSVMADRQSVAEVIETRQARLGTLTTPELRTSILFAFIASAWIFRGQLQTLPGLSNLNDQIIAVIGVVAFFIVPSGSNKEKGTALLDWKTAERIPWGVVLLFGGGLSLAGAIAKSGLAAFMATQLSGMLGIPMILLMFILVVMVLALTEFTSNVATVSALMPVIGALAIAGGMDPLTLAAPVGLAASCAFMLPMATGPNAVAYASEGITMKRMASIGIRINIIAALVITCVVYFLTPTISS